MPVSNRAKRLHTLARDLTKRFELPPDTVRAELDEYYRPAKWFLRWTDGPTVAQLTRAATEIDSEVLGEATLFRGYSDFVWALATLRLTMTTEELPPGEGYYPNDWDVRQWLEKRRAPAPRNKREQVLADRLAAICDDSISGRPSQDLIVDFVRENGVAPLLQAEGPGEAPMTPVEILTARYAANEARKTWKRRLAPMEALAAFLAVLADPEPESAVASAALALVPEVHRRIDAAAAGLQARVTD
ncbi:hypothetical protein [Streptomyces javensis]|uniref:Uncharacterized protein n=1 Tax=Streptomyces javensis TaxID=114698 RepID=A0ABS0R3H8_9ACTN|nr:hypothetical protein [Streptomyces javensis]MBI0311635.1 hypothetical protein [Streptomyces javensis]